MISSAMDRIPRVSDIKALLEKSQPADFTKANYLAKREQPSANALAELNALRAQAAAREAEFKKRQEKVDASNNLEYHDTHLPNITDLNLETAIKLKGFIEVDIEQGVDKGRNIYGSYDDIEVHSLKDYISLLNSYIADKSDTSTQPAAPSEKPPAAASPLPTPPTPGTGTTVPSMPEPSEPMSGADPSWTDPVGTPGQNHIYFPNVTSLTRETAAAVYKQVSDMVQSRDISGSVIHARNGSAGTYSVETYMSWLAQRAATNIVT